MKLTALVVVLTGIGLIAAEPALAKVRKGKPQCVDRPAAASWERLLFGGPPQPNGCAPPVFGYGRYIGQDPDPNIRAQLRRDPQTGYTQF
jgi:hypothetical protein